MVNSVSDMKWLEISFPQPAANLACDEVLLDDCEESAGSEVLRFWEPQSHFVVVGYGNRIETEVNIPACNTRGISVLRRSTGGGTILQGPGCLNYALILKIDPDGPLRTITGANRFIMERNRTAIDRLLSGIGHPASGIGHHASEIPGPMVAVSGHTDLTCAGLKFSGNAQRRRKHALLFHGTFLLGMDLQLIGTVLPLPSRQPEYRRNRQHSEFLANLPLSADAVKSALREAWAVDSRLGEVPVERIVSRSRDKYETAEWNFRI